MGAESRIPQNNKKGDGDDKLRDKLSYSLEIELQKPPDDIDTLKVDDIIALLNQLENPINQQKVIGKEEFANKYLYKKLKISHKDNYEKNSNVLNKRIAAIIFLLVVFISACNFASVRATNKNIFTNIKERASAIFFDIIGIKVKKTGKRALVIDKLKNIVCEE